jgi:hypothetical protein
MPKSPTERGTGLMYAQLAHPGSHNGTPVLLSNAGLPATTGLPSGATSPGLSTHVPEEEKKTNWLLIIGIVAGIYFLTK